MRLFITPLLALIPVASLALESQFNFLKAKGQERLANIENAKLDAPSANNLLHSQWNLENEKVDTSENEYLPSLNEAGNLGLSSMIWDRYASYPKEAEDGEKQASLEIYYDPAGGAIINSNRWRDPDNKPPLSTSDVAWALYKECCASDNVDPRKLRTIISLRVTARWSPELLNSIWDTNVDQTKPLTMQPRSDEALAILGLDNGAAVSGLLTYHNEELGHKSILSVSLFPTSQGEFHLWWTLR